MLNGILSKIIASYASEYIKNQDAKIELSNGKLSLDNVMFRESTLENVLKLNIFGLKLITCIANHFELQIPITKYKTDPMTLLCTTGFISIASEFDIESQKVSPKKEETKIKPEQKNAKPLKIGDEKSFIDILLGNLNITISKLKILFYTKEHCFLLKLFGANFVQNKKNWILGNPRKIEGCDFLVYVQKISLWKLINTKNDKTKEGKIHIMTGQDFHFYKMRNITQFEYMIENIEIRSEFMNILDFIKVLTVFMRPKQNLNLNSDEKIIPQTQKNKTKETTKIKIKKICVNTMNFEGIINKLLVNIQNNENYETLTISINSSEICNENKLCILKILAKTEEKIKKLSKISFTIEKCEKRENYEFMVDFLEININFLELLKLNETINFAMQKIGQLFIKTTEIATKLENLRRTPILKKYLIKIKQISLLCEIIPSQMLLCKINIYESKNEPDFSIKFNAVILLNETKILKLKQAKFVKFDIINGKMQNKCKVKYCKIYFNRQKIFELLEINKQFKEILKQKSIKNTEISQKISENPNISPQIENKINLQYIQILYEFTNSNIQNCNFYPVLSINLSEFSLDLENTQNFYLSTNILSEFYSNDPFGSIFKILENFNIKFICIDGNRLDLKIPDISLNLNPNLMLQIQNEINNTLNNLGLIKILNYTKYDFKISNKIPISDKLISYQILSNKSLDFIIFDTDLILLELLNNDKYYLCENRIFTDFILDSILKIYENPNNFFSKSFEFSYKDNKFTIIILVYNKNTIPNEAKNEIKIIFIEPILCYQNINENIDISYGENTDSIIPFMKNYDFYQYFNIQNYSFKSSNSKSIILNGFSIVLENTLYSFKIDKLNENNGIAKFSENKFILWSKSYDNLEIIKFSAPLSILNKISEKLEIHIFSLKVSEKHIINANEILNLFISPSDFNDTKIQFILNFHNEKYESQQYLLDRLRIVTNEGRHIEFKGNSKKSIFLLIARENSQESPEIMLKIYSEITIHNISTNTALNIQENIINENERKSIILNELNIAKINIGIDKNEKISIELPKLDNIIIFSMNFEKLLEIFALQQENENCYLISDFLIIRNCINTKNAIVKLSYLDTEISNETLEFDKQSPILLNAKLTSKIIYNKFNKNTHKTSDFIEFLKKILQNQKLQIQIINSSENEYKAVFNLCDILHMKYFDIWNENYSKCYNLEFAQNFNEFPYKISILNSDIETASKISFINYTQEQFIIKNDAQIINLLPENSLFLLETKNFTTKFNLSFLNEIKEITNNVEIKFTEIKPFYEVANILCKYSQVGNNGIFEIFNKAYNQIIVSSQNTVFNINIEKFQIKIFPFQFFIKPNVYLQANLCDLIFSQQTKTEKNRQIATNYFKVSNLLISNNFNDSVYKINLEISRNPLEIIWEETTISKLKFIQYFICNIPKIFLSVDDTFYNFIIYLLSYLNNNNSENLNTCSHFDNAKSEKLYTINKLEITDFDLILCNRISQLVYIPLDSAELHIKGYKNKIYSFVDFDFIIADLINLMKSIDFSNIKNLVTHSALFGNLSKTVSEMKNAVINSVNNSALILPELVLTIPKLLINNVLNAGITIGKNVISLTSGSNENFAKTQMNTKLTMSEFKSIKRKWVFFIII